jgi:hypothetical protein
MPGSSRKTVNPISLYWSTNGGSLKSGNYVGLNPIRNKTSKHVLSRRKEAENAMDYAMKNRAFVVSFQQEHTSCWKGTVQEKDRTRWLDLCAEAAICEDPERLQQLIDAINVVLKEEKQRLETSQVQRFRTAS